MKLDADLIRTLLLRIESDWRLHGTRQIQPTGPEDFTITDRTYAEVAYHLNFLIDEGFVKGKHTAQMPFISQLTASGRQFLNEIRDHDAWQKAKAGIKAKLSNGMPSPKLANLTDLVVSPGPLSHKVFIVHGHDEGPREAVARFLERLEFKPIILHEQPNQGRTVIEQFEAHSNVEFAVVLLTPDDVGASRGGDQKPRARQSVILELEYFIGKLTRARVCPLKKGDIELPSDILGAMWVDFDEHGAWQMKLAKELEAAGYSFDWKKIARR